MRWDINCRVMFTAIQLQAKLSCIYVAAQVKSLSSDSLLSEWTVEMRWVSNMIQRNEWKEEGTKEEDMKAPQEGYIFFASKTHHYCTMMIHWIMRHLMMPSAWLGMTDDLWSSQCWGDRDLLWPFLFLVNLVRQIFMASLPSWRTSKRLLVIL